MATEHIAIIACGIIKREIESALSKIEGDFEIGYLSPAPCIDYTNMERQLDLLLKKARENSRKVLVVVGKCHPDMDEILARYGAHRSGINDCFDALLGEQRKKLSEESNTFFTTSTWLDHWKRAFSAGMKYDEVDARQNMGGNDRILLIDTGLHQLTDEKILEYFDYVQVPVEVMATDLSHLQNLLKKEIEQLRAEE